MPEALYLPGCLGSSPSPAIAPHPLRYPADTLAVLIAPPHSSSSTGVGAQCREVPGQLNTGRRAGLKRIAVHTFKCISFDVVRAIASWLRVPKSEILWGDCVTTTNKYEKLEV